MKFRKFRLVVIIMITIIIMVSLINSNTFGIETNNGITALEAKKVADSKMNNTGKVHILYEVLDSGSVDYQGKSNCWLFLYYLPETNESEHIKVFSDGTVTSYIQSQETNPLNTFNPIINCTIDTDDIFALIFKNETLNKSMEKYKKDIDGTFILFGYKKDGSHISWYISFSALEVNSKIIMVSGDYQINAVTGEIEEEEFSIRETPKYPFKDPFSELRSSFMMFNIISFMILLCIILIIVIFVLYRKYKSSSLK